MKETTTRKRLHAQLDPLLRKRLEELEAIIDDLTLRCRALEELCIRKKVLTRAELRIMAQEIDATDGQVDGRVTRFAPPRRGD